MNFLTLQYQKKKNSILFVYFICVFYLYILFVYFNCIFYLYILKHLFQE